MQGAWGLETRATLDRDAAELMAQGSRLLAHEELGPNRNEVGKTYWRIPLHEALPVAQRLNERLSELTKHSVIAGSIRRQMPIVGDIDLVAVPYMRGRQPYLAGVERWIASTGRRKNGGQRRIRFAVPWPNRRGWEMKVEVNFVWPPAEWGPVLAVWTGPTILTVTAKDRIKRAGIRLEHGMMIGRDGRRIPAPKEEDFFSAAGLPTVPPERRHLPEALRVEGGYARPVMPESWGIGKGQIAP